MRVPEIISEKHIKRLLFPTSIFVFIICLITFLAQTRWILSPPTDTTVVLLALITGCLLIFARQTYTNTINIASTILLAGIFYVRLFTRWYINEIPDIIIYSFIDGEAIVKGYWTFTMLPLIPVVYMIFRGASAALEERSLPDRLIDIFPQLTKPGEEDLVICKTLSGKDVVIPANDRYLNTLIGGSIGTGKTSRLLAPIIYQELQAIKRSMGKGIPRGLTVLEPKGDLTDKAAEMCEDLGVPYVYINPLRDDTARFNPLEGDPMLVAEATRTVLSSIGGKQEAFFALNQEIAARNTILLLKYTKGNNLSLPDVSKALRVPDTLKDEVEKLKRIIECMEIENQQLLANIQEMTDVETDAYKVAQKEYDEKQLQISLRQNVVDFFEKEMFGVLKDKMYQFVLGLRLQFDDLAGNELLYKVIAPRLGKDNKLDYSSDINLDDHLANGGVLLVNSASNSLGNAGDAFGSYVLQHLQGAVFRRPGDETTRPRHTTIIDEVPTFIGPAFERMLSNGRSYRNENIIALQTTAQLILDEKATFRETIMNLCRNKVFYGGMDAEEAKYVSAEMGEDLQIEKTVTYERSAALKLPFLRQSSREGEVEKARYSYTDLMELPKYHVVYKVVKNNVPQTPGIGITDLCEWDKKRNKTGQVTEKKDFALQRRLGKSVNSGESPKELQRTFTLSKKTTVASQPAAANTEEQPLHLRSDQNFADEVQDAVTDNNGPPAAKDQSSRQHEQPVFVLPNSNLRLVKSEPKQKKFNPNRHITDENF